MNASSALVAAHHVQATGGIVTSILVQLPSCSRTAGSSTAAYEERKRKKNTREIGTEGQRRIEGSGQSGG